VFPLWLRDVIALLATLSGLLTFSIGLALTYHQAGPLPANLILAALICAALAVVLGRYDPEQIRPRRPRTHTDSNTTPTTEDTESTR
jgi:hypothetical protein